MSDPVGDTRRELHLAEKAVGGFAAEMVAKLAENSHKAHWGTEANTRLLRRLREEVDELRDALIDGHPREIIRECADVANFAMMIADNERHRG